MKMRGHLSLDTIDNLVIPSDSQFPEALEGELFRLTAQVEQYLPGYYLFRSGSWTPCFADQVVQPQPKAFVHGTIGAFTGKSRIDSFISAPTIDQGTEIWSAEITTQSAQAAIQINAGVTAVLGSKDRTLHVALFKGTTCIRIWGPKWAAGNFAESLHFQHVDVVPSAGPVTYSMRVGVTPNAVWYINQLNTGSDYGGVVNQSTYSLQEM